MERDGFGEFVIDNTTGTKRWKGMGADYCYALSASIFHGDLRRVTFIKVENEEEGFQALDNGTVDVLAGGKMTLQADVKEALTGKGFTFSLPYFYGDDETDL